MFKVNLGKIVKCTHNIFLYIHLQLFCSMKCSHFDCIGIVVVSPYFHWHTNIHKHTPHICRHPKYLLNYRNVNYRFVFFSAFVFFIRFSVIY